MLMESINLDWVLKGEVPPEPGTSRIPSNHIRLYHYTRVDESTDLARHRSAERLRRQGLLVSKARGSSYGEPNQIWASVRKPENYKTYVEFSVAVDDPRIAPMWRNHGKTAAQYMASGSDIAFVGDIKPREIIGVHELWHHRYRHLMSSASKRKKVEDGIYDRLLDKEEYGPAVYRAKHELGLLESIGPFESMVEGMYESDKIPCGECFSFANNLAREMLDDGIIPEDQIRVVHGTVIEPEAADPNRYVHAWVEVQGKCRDWQLKIAGKHFLPKSTYYRLFKPQDIVKYTPEEIMVNMLRHRHHGPWR